ncbi:MAG: hypothetical protein MHPSP_003644 [Paramarteilia canceri]
MKGIKLLRKIGEGAHGIVCQAFDYGQDKIIAVKKVTLKNPEKGLSLRLARELNGMAVLSGSKNVISLIKCMTCGPAVWICMDYCKYNLVSLMPGISKSDGLVKKLAEMLINGVRELQDKSILHGVLYPYFEFYTCEGFVPKKHFDQ